MSNRQARREQQRQARGGRTRQSQQRRPSAAPGGGGGPGDFISRPFLLVVGAVALVLVGIIVGVIVLSGGSTDSEEVEALLAAEANFPHDLASGYELGMDDALLVITEYEDFQCPFCLRYTATNEPSIIEEYVKTGQVKLIFKHFAVLGAESVNAGMATECAAQQDRFWDMHHELFLLQAQEGQLSNERVNAGRFSDSALRGIAEELGLDMGAYDTCYADEQTRETVAQMTLEARSFGLSGTPGFLLNGIPLAGGAPANMDGWRTLIDSELEKLADATPTAEGSPSAETTPTPAQ